MIGKEIDVIQNQLSRNRVALLVGNVTFAGPKEIEIESASGDHAYGMLKLLVDAQDRRILGVHVFGSNAAELVHIGQTVMGCGAGTDTNSGSSRAGRLTATSTTDKSGAEIALGAGPCCVSEG